MKGTLVLLDIAGYVALLLWGTHMVTSGVLRGYGSTLRRRLGRYLSHRSAAFCFGLGMTALLQSSTATGMMATSFAANGFLGLAPGLVVMLGANVGTTLVVQLLSFDIALVAPVLVLLGFVVYRRSDDARYENLGRCAIGLGLMLLALHMLVASMAPVEDTALLRTALHGLASEPVLALLVAALLTWACHSSVAVVLLVVSLATAHVVDAQGTLALVLGANLGGTLPALFLFLTSITYLTSRDPALEWIGGLTVIPLAVALGLHQSHRIGVRHLVHLQPDAVNVLDPGLGFLHGPVEVGDAQRLAEARTVG